MEITEKEILSLVKELKQYDNDAGYKLSHDQATKKLNNVTKKLIECSETCLPYIHPLLEQEETWSCTLALKIIRSLKNKKSILPLINFIKNNEDGEYWESYEDAMFALTDIGEYAINPLLAEIKSNFANRKYFTYLIGALTAIKHDSVYSFMAEILKDYIENYEKYDEWFEIEDFTYNFEVQGKKEVLPLLKKLLAMDHLSEHEYKEIESTIEIIEDPEKFNKEIEEMGKSFEKYYSVKKEDVNEKELLEKAVDFEAKKEYDNALECLAKILAVYPKSYHALFLKARVKRKIGEPDVLVLGNALDEAKKQKASQKVLELMEDEGKKIMELYKEMESTPDEDLELNFKCLSCGKRQNLKTGLIWDIEDKCLFENEILCKHCFGHELELTRDGERSITDRNMRMAMGREGGIVHTRKSVYVENKKMRFNKSYTYLLRRIKEEPLNGELYLRAGNSASKENKYEDAIRHYKKAIELNPKLIAVYVNLVEIYKYRHDYYKIKEAKDKAIYYLKKLRELYDSNDYNNLTLSNFESLIEFIREKEAELGLSSDYKKIKDEEISDTIKNASTIDIKSVSKDIRKTVKNSEQKAQKLLNENRGVLVFGSYHIFDKKTNESNRLQLSSVLPVDPSKLCLCGSGKYLKNCCFGKVRKKMPFVANLDYATYSIFEPIKKEIRTNEKYDKVIEGFKDDPRFYCEDETNRSALFLYYGNIFFTEKNLGTVVFGTMKVKKTFNNKSNIEIDTLSKNRLDALNFAVKEHLE